MGQKILVAEDEMIIGFDLCDTCEEAGFTVEGPHPGISSAMLAFQKEKPDLAILDVSLDDGKVFPLAEKLAAENIPIIFHSGNASEAEIRSHFPNATIRSKPCPPHDMIAAVSGALGDCAQA